MNTPTHRARWFFLAMAAAAVIVVFVGFAPTYYLKGTSAPPSLPARVHVHGVLFTAWIVLFFAQTALVSGRRVALHRSLGWIGALLVVPMLISGWTVAVALARAESRPMAAAAAGVPRMTVFAIALTSVVLFTLFAAFGLLYRRRPQVHKRLMLLATIALLPPALGRIPFLAARGPAAFFGVTTLFIAAVIVYDMWTRGRVHAVSLWGGLVLAASFPARVALGNTEAWQTFSRWLIR